MAMVTLLLFVIVAVIGLSGGALVGFVSAWRADRRRLDLLAERLLAETRIDASTRATLAAMREAVRRHGVP
jgi:membrane protein DedA with SNARE-associated domain